MYRLQQYNSELLRPVLSLSSFSYILSMCFEILVCFFCLSMYACVILKVFDSSEIFSLVSVSFVLSVMVLWVLWCCQRERNSSA